jgi:antitoxin component YwqK of YwqJK toxin-antitoxin module
MTKRVRSSILRTAKEVAQYLDGRKVSAEYFVRGELVGRRQWFVNGQLDIEWTYRNGRQHGLWREWHENGRLFSQTRYKDGYEHGQALQWNRHGRLIGGYRMNMGTGVDLWWGHGDVYPSEEHHMLEGLPHGFERWWTSRARVYSEDHWVRGERHGISRWWTGDKLDRGYPQFYILGKKVTKREYLKAAKSDATLPRYDSKDDSPRRKPVSLPLDRSRRLVRKVVKDAAHARHTK